MLKPFSTGRFIVFFIVLISCFFISAYSTQAQVPGKEKINQLDTNLRKQGVWKKAYPNGKLRYEGQFKDDKPVGTFKYYYETGQLKTVSGFYNNGTRTRTKTYHQNGKLLSEGNYNNEKKDSVWKFYDLTGKLQTEEYYLNDKKNGTSIVYYENGNKLSETMYKDDIKDGPYKEYFENGRVKKTATYVQNELEGDFLQNYPNEMPMLKGKYKKSLRVGYWGIYNPDGTLQVKEMYKNGIKKESVFLNGKFEDFYPNEIPKEIVWYKDGKKNGEFIEFYNAGTWKREQKTNETDGETDSYETLVGQKVKRKGQYKNDKLDGKIIYYKPDGKVEKEEVYKEGEKVK